MPQLYIVTDAVLLENIRQGDANSFNALYKKYWKEIYNNAFKRLGDRSKAEDITQDIFCKIWLNRATLSIDNLPAYFYAAVRNRVLNLFEKEKTFVSVKRLLAKKYTAEQADFLALQNEFLAAYKALVDSLPDKRKAIFHQYYELGKSTEEIAKNLSLSQKTVQNQLGRATSFLKAGLSHLFLLYILFFL